MRKSGDSHVRLNIETKIDPNHPDESPDPERPVTLVLLLKAEKFDSRVMIHSFDWRTLQLVQTLASAIPTVYYLSQQAGSEPTVYLDRPSKWTLGFNPINMRW